MWNIGAFKTTNPLDDLTIRMMNERTDFIATEVFPQHPVPKAHFKWYQYGQENLRRPVTKKSSKSSADKVDFSVFSTSGAAILHKLATEIDPADERDADEVIDIQPTSMETVIEGLLLDYEKEIYAIVSTSGNYPSSLTAAKTPGTNAWDDAAGDPVADAKTARIETRKICAKIPLDAAWAYEIQEALQVHPALIERIKFTGVELPQEKVMNLLQVRNMHIAKALENTATQGATDAKATVWGKVALFFYNNPSRNRKVMTYGRTFVVSNGLYTYQWVDDDRGGPAGRVKNFEAGWEYDPELVARATTSGSTTACGYLYTTVTA